MWIKKKADWQVVKNSDKSLTIEHQNNITLRISKAVAWLQVKSWI